MALSSSPLCRKPCRKRAKTVRRCLCLLRPSAKGERERVQRRRTDNKSHNQTVSPINRKIYRGERWLRSEGDAQTNLIELKAIKTKQPTSWQAASPPSLCCCLTCCRKVVKEIGARAGITVLHAIQIQRRLRVDGIARHPIGQIILRVAVDLVLLAIGQTTRWLQWWCTCIMNDMN